MRFQHAATLATCSCISNEGCCPRMHADADDATVQLLGAVADDTRTDARWIDGHGTVMEGDRSAAIMYFCTCLPGGFLTYMNPTAWSVDAGYRRV